MIVLSCPSELNSSPSYATSTLVGRSAEAVGSIAGSLQENRSVHSTECASSSCPVSLDVSVQCACSFPGGYKPRLRVLSCSLSAEPDRVDGGGICRRRRARSLLDEASASSSSLCSCLGQPSIVSPSRSKQRHLCSQCRRKPYLRAQVDRPVSQPSDSQRALAELPPVLSN